MSDEDLTEIKRYHFERNKHDLSHDPTVCHACCLIVEVERLQKALANAQLKHSECIGPR